MQPFLVSSRKGGALRDDRKNGCVGDYLLFRYVDQFLLVFELVVVIVCLVDF